MIRIAAPLVVLATFPVTIGALRTQAPPAWLQPATAAVGTSSLHGIVFDSVRNRTVMFGGWTQLYLQGFRNQTWEWDGNVWTQVVTAHAPSPRSHCMLAFDSGRGRVVLFGGYATNLGLGDTWEYDGVDWIQRTPTHSPSPRFSAGLAYDPARNVTVLFGGGTGPSGLIVNDETWEWNGSDWSLRSPTNAPSPRSDMGMCFDPALQRVVIHRGYGGAAGVTRDLWAYDGINWSLLDDNEGPPAGYNGGLVWHPVRQRLLACLQTGTETRVWTWDGSTWHSECATGAPSGRRVFQMAYHAPSDRVVVYGGDIGATATYSDTLLLDAGNPQAFSLTSFGTGCASSTGTVLLQAVTPPMLGTPFTSQMTGAPAGLALFVFGFSSLGAPLSLGFLGMPTACNLYVSPDVVLGVAHAGTADFTVDLPCAVNLYGADLFVQAAAFDPDLPDPLPIATSNALHAVLGS